MFLRDGGPRYPSVNTVKLGKTQKYVQSPWKNHEKVRF